VGEGGGAGVLSCAQDDGKNEQRQGQLQRLEQTQIPFGDDNQEKQRHKQAQQKQATARTGNSKNR
jgi:hypothetical protein